MPCSGQRRRRRLTCAQQFPCCEMSQSRLETAQNANKALRFAKMNQDVGLLFQKLGDVKYRCTIAVSDVAWGVRKDHKSQGGYFVLLAHKDAMNGKADQPYIVLDWRSYKLPRNSLNSESQACAGALEYLLLFWQGCSDVSFELQSLDKTSETTPSALVVDAKAYSYRGIGEPRSR